MVFPFNYLIRSFSDAVFWPLSFYSTTSSHCFLGSFFFNQVKKKTVFLKESITKLNFILSASSLNSAEEVVT